MAVGGPLFLLLWLFSAGVLLSCEASIHDYGGRRFAVKGNAFVLQGGREGLYASAPSPNSSAPASGNSFIRFEKITFRRPKEAAAKQKNTGTVKAIIFEVEDRKNIGGSAYGGQRAICCTADLANLGACTQGTIIYRHSDHSPDWPQVLSASFKGSNPEASLPSKTIQITRTGMYNLYFIFCDPSLEGIEIQGKTIWKNPTGYLPGSMRPLMKFYGLVSFAFLMLGICWFSQHARFWTEMMPLQNCITLVIALGMIETTLWYFEYAELNHTGIRPKDITFWAVTFGAVKRTVSRVLVLIVSMGYGVVRPTVGGLTSKVTLLGGTFFGASEILGLVENVGTVSDVSGKPRLFLALPVGVLDAFFIIWIFTSLSKTLKRLQARRMSGKLEIYRKFTYALIVTVLVSVAWTGFELYFKATDAHGQRWQGAWMISALWQVLSFTLLCVICALWAPSQNSMRFAYLDDGSEDFDQEDSRSLIKPLPYSYKDSRSFSASAPDSKRMPKVDTAAPKDEDNEEEKTE
ncbi:lung seven transmembrane domain containing protein [Musa troglodytarum]|uniref:Lung seven transmembrane domain containing protein n=1 Tax=Musa troglodytarum TaxID=320322 RepID=A0A9E7K7V1_9LILI|nr:lung seven transmembrane domain containing protein [Musa troglodytarum]URE34763.1 lung seven transmembrane domain containing protein [Musa troglodytarum]